MKKSPTNFFTFLIILLSCTFFISPSLRSETAAGQPVVKIELARPAYETKGILEFDIVVENPAEKDFEIKILKGKPPFNFQIGDSLTWEEREVSYAASSFIRVKKGESKVIASFNEDIRALGLQGRKSVKLQVWVDGVGSDWLEVELRKPDLFESAAGRMFRAGDPPLTPPLSLREREGRPKGEPRPWAG